MYTLFLAITGLISPVFLATCPRYSSGANCDCDPGFWLDPRSDFCSVCPHTTTCTGGSSLPVAGPGFYLVSTTPFSVAECPGKATKCLGANACSEGFTGPLCNECATDFEQYGASTAVGEIQCERCISGLGCWRGLPLWAVYVICSIVLTLEISYLVWKLRKHRFFCFRDPNEQVRIIDPAIDDLY